MADDPVLIEAQLTRLRAARGSGILIVRHGDTQTTYRTMAEIDQAIATLTGELNRTSETPRTRVRYPIQLTKGL